jgi:TPR repeat protein
LSILLRTDIVKLDAGDMRAMISEKGGDPEDLFVQAEKYEEVGDLEKAFGCLLRAARLGHSGSQLNVGHFYSSGQGTGQSAKRAAYWYRRAYKNGNSGGAFSLAVDKRNAGNVRGAVSWFRKAAAMGDGDAYIELAKIYLGRRGGKRMAVDLLRKTQSMNRDAISDNSKEEAAALLVKL